MNPYHLTWILPVAMAVGAFMACVIIGGARK